MSRGIEGWERRERSFWYAHHEAWKRSDLNQREYCEAHDLPLKAFGNWRTVFKTEPEPKLLHRRGGLSHTLSHMRSHTFGHGPSHVTYPSSEVRVPPLREGHRRRFSDAERRRILEEAGRPGASLSEVARHYGIARRVLCRWKQSLASANGVSFVQVEIVDGVAS